MNMLQALRARWHYRERGYQVFRDVFPADEVMAIAALARQIPAHAGKLRRQDGVFAANDFFPGTTLVRNPLLHPHLSLPGELAPLSAALRQFVTSPAIATRLRMLDGRRQHYVVHQVLLFLAAQTTDMHLDSWSLDTSPRGLSHTVWIPLQPMDHRSGVPCVIPWPRRGVVTESMLGLTPGGADPQKERYDAYHRALRDQIMSSSPEIVSALVRPGDFMAWSSLTPHFTMPSHPAPVERLSLQVLIRPATQRWGDFLNQPHDRHSLQLVRVSPDFSIKIMDGEARREGSEGHRGQAPYLSAD